MLKELIGSHALKPITRKRSRRKVFLIVGNDRMCARLNSDCEDVPILFVVFHRRYEILITVN